MWYTKKAEVITIHVYVQPGAKSTEIIGLHDGTLKIRLSCQAMEGRANEALKKYMAQLFHVPNQQVRLVRGDKGRRKTLEIVNSVVSPAHLLLIIGKE